MKNQAATADKKTAKADGLRLDKWLWALHGARKPTSPCLIGVQGLQSSIVH
nr:hypothetical protein [uncultured Roseateles sp.]